MVGMMMDVSDSIASIVAFIMLRTWHMIVIKGGGDLKKILPLNLGTSVVLSLMSGTRIHLGNP